MSTVVAISSDDPIARRDGAAIAASCARHWPKTPRVPILTASAASASRSLIAATKGRSMSVAVQPAIAPGSITFLKTWSPRSADQCPHQDRGHGPSSPRSAQSPFVRHPGMFPGSGAGLAPRKEASLACGSPPRVTQLEVTDEQLTRSIVR